MVLKFKPKLNLKFMLKGSKTVKLTKGSKNSRRLTQLKAMQVFFLHRNKQEILIYYGNKEIYAKNIVSHCVVCFEHCNDILNAKSIEKEYLNIWASVTNLS